MKNKTFFEKFEIAGRLSRYADAMLAVFFAYLFYRDQEAWWWAAAAVLCVVTAVWGPVENGALRMRKSFVKTEARKE